MKRKRYEANPAKLEKLTTLQTDPNFHEFKELLDSRISVHLEGLVTTESRIEYRRGYVKGLKDAYDLLDAFLEGERSRQKHAREQRERSDEHRKREQRRLATFGTQWHQRL